MVGNILILRIVTCSKTASGTLQMKNKHRRKRTITWSQFNKKMNQFLLELGLKKQRELEEQHYLQLLTENEDFDLIIKRRLS